MRFIPLEFTVTADIIFYRNSISLLREKNERAKVLLLNNSNNFNLEVVYYWKYAIWLEGMIGDVCKGFYNYYKW